MKWQSDGFACGATALHNALEALGVSKSVEELIALSGTTPTDGANENDLLSALKKLGYKPEGHYFTAKGAEKWGEAWLRECLLDGHPVLLGVDYDEKTKDTSHWVCARGLLGKRILVADSAHTVLEPSYTWGELMHRWKGGGRCPYYGIEIK